MTTGYSTQGFCFPDVMSAGAEFVKENYPIVTSQGVVSINPGVTPFSTGPTYTFAVSVSPDVAGDTAGYWNYITFSPCEVIPDTSFDPSAGLPLVIACCVMFAVGFLGGK